MTTTAEYRTRPWRTEDVPFLWDMLHASFHVRDGDEPFPRSVLERPEIAKYLVDFGDQVGDDAQVALDEAGQRVGAAWCRSTTAAEPGYGFVAPDVPELGMAVAEPWRGRGVGRSLLVALLDRNPTMSLSVDDQNSGAARLYESLGFVAVGSDATSITMLRRSRDRGPGGPT